MSPESWGARALAFASAAAAVALLTVSPPAEAFPWMIHHSYNGCAQCHLDPSGGGILTEYGRAQGDILLRTHYQPPPEKGYEVGPVKDFLFGATKLDPGVQLQADVRGLVIPDPANVQAMLMQADLRGAFQTKHFVASGAIGGVSRGAEGARLSSGDTWNLVSREYWVGVTPNKAWTVRVGRMNLPFGIRTEDHILDVRAATRTNTNDDQQFGLAAFYNSRKVRGEVMAVYGNTQVHPGSFRDKGYSGYVAWAPKNNIDVGVSSLYLAAKTDVLTFQQRNRFINGAFVRWAPIPELAVLAEGDVLIDNQPGVTYNGFVSTAIVDYEPIQGLHLQGIGEQCDDDFGDNDPSALTGTVAAQWFFTRRFDVRVDAGYGTVYCTPGTPGSPFGLVQAHFFL